MFLHAANLVAVRVVAPRIQTLTVRCRRRQSNRQFFHLKPPIVFVRTGEACSANGMPPIPIKKTRRFRAASVTTVLKFWIRNTSTKTRPHADLLTMEIEQQAHILYSIRRHVRSSEP